MPAIGTSKFNIGTFILVKFKDTFHLFLQNKKSISSSSDNGTPSRKETVYAKMVSLRRRTTSGDLKRFLSIPNANRTSTSTKSKKGDQQRSRIHSADSGMRNAPYLTLCEVPKIK